MYKIIYKVKKNVRKLIRLKESRYLFSFLFLLLIIILLDTVIYFYEVPEDNSINSVIDIIWWNIVTLTTVGYGDMYPTTIPGKVATILIMICGIASVAYILSALVEYFIQLNQRKEQGLLRVKMENHIIICNWNERAEDLFNQLNSFEDLKDEVVLIDNELDSRPSPEVHFVKGSPTEIETLRKANIDKAKRVLILAKGKNKSEADANTVLSALAIRSLRSDVIICAEILDPHNSLFLKNARVDQVIDINSLISRFIAQTTYNPKLLAVLNELVSNSPDSCEIYRCNIPEHLKNMTFSELLKEIKEKYDCLIIALEDSEGDKVIINPKMNQVYKADHCFVIAEDQPEFS